MSSFGIRPRFSQILDVRLEDAQARIVREVGRADDACEIKSFPGYLCLRIPEADRHFWSPRLTLSLEEAAGDKTRIEGIYGPNANVWGLFVYGYLIVGSLGIFSGTLGFAQWKLGSTPWGMWIFAAMLVLAGALYVLAQFGQKLGALQTFRLHQIYESSVGRHAEIH